MGQHILQLNFPDTTNEGVFLVDDISIYDPTLLGLTAGASASTTTPCSGVTIACGNLQITPPGFYTPTSLNLQYGNFRLVLNACTLGILSSTGCTDACPALPDGMYNVRYSVSPNDKVFVEYKIFRITQAINRYYNLLCRIGLTPCLPSQDTDYQIRSLETIYTYLIAAKTTVEIQHQFNDGMNLYRFAVGLMDKMSFEPNRC
jgi:hypothetical protein